LAAGGFAAARLRGRLSLFTGAGFLAFAVTVGYPTILVIRNM
jgi:hypothetical protein